MSSGDSVANPLTPDQSKAQVVQGARDVASVLPVRPVRIVFHHESCNDQNEAPFRGVVGISYPRAASFDASDAEVAAMIQQLQARGWSGDADFKTHGSAVTKNGVVAVFAPQNASTPNRGVDVYGECRDVTSTKDDTRIEDITLD